MKRIALDLTLGLLTALFSCAIILGAISLSMVEGDSGLTEKPGPLVMFFQNTTTTQQIEPGSDQEPVCVVPAGWIPYIIQSGDTLDSLVEGSTLSAEDLKTINCLPDDHLIPGTMLHLPPDASTNRQANAPCSSTNCSTMKNWTHQPR